MCSEMAAGEREWAAIICHRVAANPAGDEASEDVGHRYLAALASVSRQPWIALRQSTQ